MRLKFGSAPVAFALLLALLVFALPQTARATDSFDDAGCNNNYVQTMGAEAQANTEAAMQPFINTPVPDIKNVYCWDKLNAAFQMILSVADPMGIIQAILGSIVQNILNQLCTVALNELNSLTSGLNFMAQLCIPMPGLTGFNMSTGSFGMPSQGACNGIPLISVGASLSTSGAPMAQPYSYKVLGMP